MYAFPLIGDAEVQLRVIVDKSFLGDTSALVCLPGDGSHEIGLDIFRGLPAGEGMGMGLRIVSLIKNFKGNCLFSLLVEHFKGLVDQPCNAFREGVLDILKKI